MDQYPLPIVDDLLATLPREKKFTKLDLTQAYLQLALHPESKEYCTVNTHRGLYRLNRLPFGIASAPALFQKVMDTILQGIPGAMCSIDDILVTGPTDEAHLQTLEEVFRRLQNHGIRMKKSKCYLLRRKFTLVTDHKPLTSIFGPKKIVPSVAAAPLQQWALFLQRTITASNFARHADAHGNADVLSRLPLPTKGSQVSSEKRLCKHS